MDKVQKIKAEIYSLQDMTMDADGNFNSSYDNGRYDALCSLDAFIDSILKEPVKDLEEAATFYSNRFVFEGNIKAFKLGFIEGANWKNEHDSQKFIHEESATFTRDQFNAEIRQAKEEIINKAIEWLYQQQLSVHNIDEFISDFKKYMEDEK